MFHSRADHSMSGGAQSDIELQGVRSFADTDTPPPQTRPFTGVLDQHHCLLPQPQTQLSGSQIPPQPASASANYQKRHSSGVHPPEKGHHNPQHRHSSGSQKLRSGGPTQPPPPYSSVHMPEARREERNGISLTACDENHIPGNNTARSDRNAAIAVPMMQDTDLSAASNSAPRSGGTVQCIHVQPAATSDSVMEDTDDRPSQAPDWGDNSSANNDRIDGVLRKARNNYERLRAEQSSSQHLYRPIVENSAVRPSKASVAAPNPSKSSKPSQGATSPLYDSADVCTLQVRPQSKPNLPSKRAQPADHSEDIIELQSDVKSVRSREEKQNKSNAQKEVPEVTEIPNTNFAIACMVALCFNLPFGVLAMFFSLRAVKAFQDGRAKLGERRSRWSIVLSLLGITITTVIISSVVLYTAMQGQKRISRHKAYGSRAGLNL